MKIFFPSDTNYYGDMKFKIRNIHVSVVAKFDFDNVMITELKSLNIHENEFTIDMSSFEVNIHGDILGIAAHVVEGIVHFVNAIAKNDIVNLVEGPIKDFVKENVVGKNLMELIGMGR